MSIANLGLTTRERADSLAKMVPVTGAQSGDVAEEGDKLARRKTAGGGEAALVGRKACHGRRIRGPSHLYIKTCGRRREYW